MIAPKMFPRRNARILTGIGFLTIAGLMVYKTVGPFESTKNPEALHGPRAKSARDDAADLLTQSPQHLRKQKEYENQILANIQKMSAHKAMQRRMNHDPMGVILHKRPSLLQGLGRVRDMKEQAGSVVQRSVVPENQLKHKIVHLDLKGAPPKVEYFKKLFPLLHSFGATGLLMEYEDMFPYWGKLEFLSAHNAYAKGDIADIIELAKKSSLIIIPLVQTFGHMEHVLKLKEFAELREVPNYPQVVCPTNNKTLPLIKMMIDQVMQLHPGTDWLHIGSDEVYNLGECTRCQQYLLHHQFGKSDLFLHHVRSVAKYVKENYDVQPIMWDDEFRKIPLKAMEDSKVGEVLEIMVWKYSSGIMVDLRSDIWEKYSTVFGGIWVASAFKGAANPDSYITNINDRLSNHKEWMEIFELYKSTIPFQGIVLTGWQRFDHFGVLCELLPQAVPSLAVNLMYINERKADHGALVKVGDMLKCSSFINLDLQYLEYANKCDFPGSAFYEVSQKLYILKRDINTMMKNPHVTGWVSDYNIEHNFVSPQHAEQGLQDLTMLLFDYGKVMNEAETALSDVFDEYTVKEWISLNVKPTHTKLQKLHASISKLQKVKYWPRRPLDSTETKEL
ncbi:hexosaminidase D-like [Portunus trituberculatus]|uniref:beta-N-acetylhexosaminidase n=1 Tax=Portunus trituberculatus TaxID=210409 RepID=A0A5B7CK95_PORTR|nr:hexosaminidase D-like [Portunus trituberculatus]XP_045118946.1 hexosaminidase D-like [Portunus trituberculatus]XP_045118947.1 hexosaminidase D-like [Portunus trituberculatus]XP_045118948.1 hexosaminidase D-like [Portunus trituberculatus]XP_045118949.1 hexosaminidase D-like [Portunus trituberculatus]XP_045118950.1 hexosaminidase D-like [Portunus trituberculatus]XP_045118951.1 hexosaminidase D-like [Portunus trituberculatus]XP_045118952.1 hexosaminidase D-like [Portunus trituberculatus]MPC